MSADFTFLKGNIETIILCALYNKDMYGYELAKSIKERSRNKYEIKQPTLYSYLKRLEQDGYVYAYWGGESSGGRRRYYKLTEKGRSDCEKFLAEWEYQRNVMGSLVDGTAEVEPMGDASKLLGRKTPRKRKQASSFDEQDEISRRLSELDGLTDEPSDEQPAPPQTDVATTVVEEPVVIEQPAPEPIIQQQVTPPVRQNNIAIFDLKQDDAETFISDFDRLADESSQKLSTGTSQPKQGENYQHTLLNILGDQLDEVRADVTTSQPQAQSIDTTAELEEVADKFAREGIRLRIYNHATANFKSKTLIPLPQVICNSFWMTYLVAVVVFGLLCLTSISVGNWLAPLITLAILLLLPIGSSLYALSNPIRTEKPAFNFKVMFLGAITLAGIVILTCIAISIFNNIELSNYKEIVNKILIPSAIALLPATYIYLFNYNYNKY